MDLAVFRRLCDHAHAQAGIALGPSKEALVAARIGKRLRALGLADERAYLDFLEGDKTGEELVRFLDVISTNHTSFFREPDHFQTLREVMQLWYQNGQRHFRVWSAASSTGEEAYSVAMTVRDALPHTDLDFKILATDISTRVLTQAQKGVYSIERLETIPRNFHARFVERSSSSTEFNITEILRQDVVYRRLNLSQPPFPMRGPFDIVFCRNVLIYFDNPVRQRLISAIESLLRPDGWLFIGHTETLTGIETRLRAIRPSVFRKPGPDGDAAA